MFRAISRSSSRVTKRSATSSLAVAARTGGSPMIVVITGASAGVGRAAARAFADDGWDVALIARGVAGLEAAAQEVRATGRRALAVTADVADAEAGGNPPGSPQRGGGAD